MGIGSDLWNQFETAINAQDSAGLAAVFVSLGHRRSTELTRPHDIDGEDARDPDAEP